MLEELSRRDLLQILSALKGRGDHKNGDPDWRGLVKRLDTAEREMDVNAGVRERVLPQLRERRWVCQVVRSGYHNGAYCNEKDPHEDWDCGWRHEVSLSAAEYKKIFRT